MSRSEQLHRPVGSFRPLWPTALQAANGLTGVALAHANIPEVALLDIGLQGIDGYEVARRLRHMDSTAAIRMITLTFYGLAEEKKRVLEAGFDLHLVKPVYMNALLDALGSAVHAVAD